MTLESLDKMNDEELLQVRARAGELLKSHDAERKAKAVADAKALKEKAQLEARALLASVGLSLKAVAPKRRRAGHGKHGGGDATPLTKRAG
jgi:hypothetical protein